MSKIPVRLQMQLKESVLATSNIQGSGVIYATSDACNYIYVFTALHCILGTRTETTSGNSYLYNLDQIEHVMVEHNENLSTSEFTREKVLSAEIIINMRKDIAIIKVNKRLIAEISSFPKIVLHEKKRFDGRFRSAGFLGSNRNQSSPFEYHFISRSPDGIIVCRSEGSIQSDNALGVIGGYSGSGLFFQESPILAGIITKLPDENATGDNIHAVDLSLIDINKMLSEADENNELVNYTNNARKIFVDEDNVLVDLSAIEINGVKLNLWKAVGNTKYDMSDDWFQDAIRFDDLLNSQTIYTLIKEKLSNGPYIPDNSELYAVPKEGFTTRKAIQTTLTDRIVFQAAVDYIAREVDPYIKMNTYSARYNFNERNNYNFFFINSVEQWQKFQHQILESIDDENPFLLVTDITNYYDNISEVALKRRLNDYKNNSSDPPAFEKVTELICSMVKSWQQGYGYTSNGIPQNREASAFLANLFLAKVDQAMIIEFPFYFRFMDDIRILCKDKFQARKALMVLIDKLSDIGLNLNSQKTIILNSKDDKDRDIIKEYTPTADKQIEQINSLINVGRYRELQIAIFMVNDLFHEAVRNYDKKGFPKKFRFAIDRLQRFARTPFLNELINYSEIVIAIIDHFEDNPWHSEIYINFLMAIDSKYIGKDLLDLLIPIITDPVKNIYPWQSFVIFKLLAYHKIPDKELQQHAKKLIIEYEQLNKAPEIAGACLYIASVESDAVDLIKDSFNNGKFRSRITTRSAVLCLQSIAPTSLNPRHLDPLLIRIHETAYAKFIEKNIAAPLIAAPSKVSFKNITRDLPQFTSM